ncbi:MAG: GNAT family N-acetyltransferase [Pseudomonadota bacterium]
MSATIKAPEPLERHEVTIQYLEQDAPKVLMPIATPGKKLAVMRAEKPPVGYYRFLFNGVGEKHRWVSRRYLPDTELQALIHHDDIHIYPLLMNGSPMGYSEIDAKDKENIVIRFFGLLPEAQGLGLGRWFFRETTRLAWSFTPRRVRIETCSLDSPRALQLYQREGFSIYDRATGVIEWYG